ncbi:adenylate kinase 9-like [Calliopsis andreniformis]|uniref:adenylate kinase 9-like n=1 Tax=Calliopsis andreniformis TaxID=337506 RepID=UPI003FCDEA82
MHLEFTLSIPLRTANLLLTLCHLFATILSIAVIYLAMCDKVSRHEKRDERKNDGGLFYAHTSFIIKKSFFRYIKGYPREEVSPSWLEPHRCVYPKANVYYAFVEDTNPFSRFSANCQSRKYGNVQPHFEPFERPHEIRDPYYGSEARGRYLQKEPTCFAIFGKPDLNTTKLATMIAESWNCVLISPAALIKEEMDKGTEKGKVITEILKTGECLGPGVVVNLVEDRINRRDVLHRGYVVDGLPLIQNEALNYCSYPSYAKGDIAENLAQYFMKLFDSSFYRICGKKTGLEESCSLSSDAQESSISSDQKFKNDTCTTRPNYEHYIPSQIENMFTTWPIKPSIIIYAVCPSEDVVRKREHFRLDSVTGRVVDTSHTGMNRNIETLFSHDRTEIDMNVSFELYQELMSEERILDEHQRKYLLKRLPDRKSNVEAQCELYKHYAIPTIEKWITLHNPENVIRVDARSPVSRMFQTVIARLRILPIPRVILPKRFSDPVQFEGESPAMAEPMDEFEGKSAEEAFRDLTNRETISPLYPWRLSPWNFLCPVELARGRTVEGLSKFIVRFMNKIFFLSSAEAVDLFIENPRTFLIPFSPRPTCKIAIFGPKYSGKSDLAKKLAQEFRGTVLNVNEVVKAFVDADSNIYFDSPSKVSLQERTDIIVREIQNIPEEEIGVEVWRDGGYIVDGMYPDIDNWKMVVEDSNIIFEDVILLYDEEPYEYLLSKWHNIHDAKDSHVDLEEYEEYPEDIIASEDRVEEEEETGEEEEEPGALVLYLRHIQQFQLDWEEIRERVADSCKNLITCNLNKINDVPKYVIELIKDRYANTARVMSDEEKEREKDLAEYMAMTDTDNLEDEEAREGGEETTELDVKEDNRRFGDTNCYCPVALLHYNIFWRGKEDFSAIFMNKIYLLSSAQALEQFISNPQKLNLPFRKPLSRIPSLHISILGPLGSGKTTLADAISREYGVAHVDFYDSQTQYMNNRGMLPVTRRSSLILPADLAEEVELPEDLSDERYNSDEATVQTFVRRYWKAGGVLPEKMLQECLIAYFEEFYSFCGVLLDSFPSCSEDVEIAIKEHTVPEMVIELRCSKDKAYAREVPVMCEIWREILEEKKRIEEHRYLEELDVYERDRDLWIEKMLSEAFDQYKEHEMEEDVEDIDPELIELKRFELGESWLRKHPEPKLFTDWEDFETAKERIEQAFEETYEDESRKIEAVRNALENESIPYIVVDAERSVREVFLHVVTILAPYLNRNISALEKVYTIDLETAEMLLDCGYYLLSSFGRWCPVQLHEDKTPIQMFLPMEAKQEIYPVIHREFIYFLGGKDAHAAFLKNPLMYLEQDSCGPIIPFRLSIIGPPKCGKTTLARRFAKTYGLKIVTRGAALRHILRYFPWTESAQSTESRLRAGHMAPGKALLRTVEMYSVDPRSTSQGFVLDGFPTSCEEFEELTYLGLQPMLIFDLKANLEFCSYCLSREADETKKPPNFSEKFLEHRYKNWSIDQESFRQWLKRFTQNVIELDGSKSMWYMWTRADEEVRRRYTNIRRYFRESDYDKVHRLEFMSVSPYEFKKRQSLYESYCPLCLFHENITKTSGSPPDHQGMVQFREHFYWICPQHLNEFIRKPERYLPPLNTARLPKDRPRVLTEIVDKEHPCWSRRLQVGGFCLVTYVDNLPSRKLVPGKSNISVLYKDNVYLFCSEECRNKFLLRDTYAKVEVKFLRTIDPIDIRGLPNLGFLEQTVIKVLVQGITETTVFRPKLPGVSPSVAAAIFLGVFLKINNVSCPIKDAQIYETVCARMFSRDKILKVAVRTIKKKINPYVNMPIYRYRSRSQFRMSGEMSVLSHFFIKPLSLITFRRTSPTQILHDPSEEES